MDDEGSLSLGEPTTDGGKAKRESLFRSLHVCDKLSGNGRFHVSGNGLGATFADSLVLWFQGEREEGSPDSRTRKSARSSFIRQNAVDAMLALANIADRTAPYCWENDPRPLEPERGSYGQRGGAVLAKEVASFVDQFGLPHMRSDGWGPGTRKLPLEALRLSFTDDYDRDFDAQSAMKRLMIQSPISGYSSETLKDWLKRDGLFVEGSKWLTTERVYFRGMEHLAKDFSHIDGVKWKIRALEKEEKRIEAEADALVRQGCDSSLPDGSFDEAAYDRCLEEADRHRSEIRHLHLGKEDLLDSCRRAYDLFSDDEREGLSQNGCIEFDVHRMYLIALLFHDALDLYMAANGDEAAFSRVLGKIHMEIFDVDSVEAGDGCADPTAVKSMAAGCYTIWFESCGLDPDNPGSDKSYYSYQPQLSGCSLSLSRQEERAFERQELYGCGRAVHVLCAPGETPARFGDHARKYLPDFLDGLIKEGIGHNYKELFADSASIDPKKPLISVNDFGADLVRTLWGVMDLVRKGEIPLKLARCECCGRLMNSARNRGNARSVCDSSCRSLLRKRKAKGTESEIEKMRRGYFSFVESAEAVHVGMSLHMGPEMQHREEASDFGGAVASAFAAPFDE